MKNTFCSNCKFYETADEMLSGKNVEVHVVYSDEHILDAFNKKSSNGLCTYGKEIKLNENNVVNETYKILIINNCKTLNKYFNCPHYKRKSFLIKFLVNNNNNSFPY